MSRVATEAQRAAARLNGTLGGRPPNHAGNAELRRIRERARELGQSGTLASVRFLLRVVRGDVKEATVSDRLRASEALMDRFGFPRLQQTQLLPDFPVKIIDMSGWEGSLPTGDGADPPKVEEPTAH